MCPGLAFGRKAQIFKTLASYQAQEELQKLKLRNCHLGCEACSKGRRKTGMGRHALAACRSRDGQGKHACYMDMLLIMPPGSKGDAPVAASGTAGHPMHCMTSMALTNKNGLGTS